MTAWQAFERRFSRRWVPPHLVATYPADFTLFLLTCALLAVRFTVDEPLGAMVVAAAGTSAALLLGGWIVGRASLTSAGALLGIGVWLGHFGYLSTYALLVAFSRIPPAEAPFGGLVFFGAWLLCLAGVNEAWGVYTKVRMVEDAPGGRWWMTSRHQGD